MRQEYSIVARYGKNGKIYYVRYFRDNKMIPSQWSTGTGDYREAETFAITNREKILKKYDNRKEGKVLYSVLRSYYAQGSNYLAIDAARGRKLNESSRKILYGFIVNAFIPFLLENRIKEFGEIKPVVINHFQNYLLIEKGLQPQSINRQISGIKAIFSHLYMTGIIEYNLIKDIVPLRNIIGKIRGCYSMEELAGVFKTEWEDKKSYLLCSLIYSAGLRNSEIQNLKVKDIIVKGGIHFLNIEKSKTASGIRIVPLHPKLLEALERWIAENRLSSDDFLLVKDGKQRLYRLAKTANIVLGALAGKNSDELDSANISFYSGRHFYKTMLNSYGLGEIEELFMGHRINREVSERYNHKNKRGEKELLKKAKEALKIINETLY
jgi:integrase